MSDVFWAIGMVLGVLALIFGFVFGIDKLVSNSERKGCAQVSELYGHPTKYYGTDKGCIMEINGQKIKVAV